MRVLPDCRDLGFFQAVAASPHQRERLERLCRYITRPAICLDRLSINAAGQVVLELKNPVRDGTTHILFDPADFIARLAALVPRPRANLTRYHGVFAPNCKLRSAVIPKQRKKPAASPAHDQTQESHGEKNVARSGEDLTAPLSWAQRLKRVFLIDWAAFGSPCARTVVAHCG